jgi:hypothetical protein
MKHPRLKVLAVLAAGALATSLGIAQTINSPGVNPGGPASSSPISGAPNPGSLRNEPVAPLSGQQSNAVTPPPAAPSPVAPSASAGTTMSSGPDRALATPEDRATCSALSGTAQADCMADIRRQRESRGGRM